MKPQISSELQHTTNKKTNRSKAIKGEDKQIEVDYFTKTPEAKALMTAHKRQSPNKMGHNQYSLINNLVPYPLKYAIADALLKDNKTIEYVVNYTGLSREIVQRLKKGEIKLLSNVVERVKEHESQNLVMLGNSILDSINEKDLDKASLLQKVTSASILIDKRRLIDGQSTENISVVQRLSEIQPKADQADKLLETIKSRLNQ